MSAVAGNTINVENVLRRVGRRGRMRTRIFGVAQSSKLSRHERWVGEIERLCWARHTYVAVGSPRPACYTSARQGSRASWRWALGVKMIYVIRLIKRLSAQNVRAYTGRANLRPSDARRWERVVRARAVARKDRTRSRTEYSPFFASCRNRLAEHGRPLSANGNTL